MFRIEWWYGEEYRDQRVYLTERMFTKYLTIFSTSHARTSHYLKIYKVVDSEWKQLKHSNGIII